MRLIIEQYIKDWENKCYSNGIPDEIHYRLDQLKKAPSYKQIVIAILNNDHTLKSLGFEAKKSKYYHLLKRIELSARDKEKQLSLFN